MLAAAPFLFSPPRSAFLHWPLISLPRPFVSLVLFKVSDQSRLGLDVSAWAYWALLMLLALAQAPLLFGLCINPLYRCTSATPDGCLHVPARQRRLGQLYMLLRTLAPCLTLAYTSAMYRVTRPTSPTLLAFATVRAYRWAWQSPSRALLEVRYV
jgi:hypothetical protein